MSDDRDLLEQWQRGDQDAGNTLLERHYRSLYYFFANKVDDDIDDLVQGTLLACVRSRKRFRRQSSFRTYLFAVALNEFRGYLRRHKGARDRIDYSVTSLRDLGITPRSRLAKRNQYHHLLTALRSLSIDQQILLELRYWQEASVPDLCDIFQTTQNAIYARLSRARRALLQHLRALSGDLAANYETLEDLDSWAQSIRAERGGENDQPAPDHEPQQ